MYSRSSSSSVKAVSSAEAVVRSPRLSDGSSPSLTASLSLPCCLDACDECGFSAPPLPLPCSMLRSISSKPLKAGKALLMPPNLGSLALPGAEARESPPRRDTDPRPPAIPRPNLFAAAPRCADLPDGEEEPEEPTAEGTREIDPARRPPPPLLPPRVRRGGFTMPSSWSTITTGPPPPPPPARSGECFSSSLSSLSSSISASGSRSGSALAPPVDSTAGRTGRAGTFGA
mmetsp:Transcript_811/g.2556  ORF Transcript_811/g.2556 Transcript_811/m.2556 type:complete len:230 (+) Transcript_811:851-1540(+)